jgi:gamma-glutamyltranspeptidase/glutathione hydrolase
VLSGIDANGSRQQSAMLTTRHSLRFSLIRALACAGAVIASALFGACASSTTGYRTAIGLSGSFEHGAVAADHVIASQAGAEMLAAGGNAIDAAVATSFTLSVVRPYSCGIGGGGFMVIHLSDAGLADQKKRGREVARDAAIDYRETTPRLVTPDFYEKDADALASRRGAKAVAVPGTPAGLLWALDRYGTLDRTKVLAPAIRAAEEGFIVDDHYMSMARRVTKAFRDTPEMQTRFAFLWERFLRKGDVHKGDRIKLPEQAAALRLIAQRGADAFRDGPIAEAILAAIARDKGVLDAGDLQGFRVDATEPLTTTAFGRTFLTMPPPSSGGICLAQTMGILERTWVKAEAAGAAIREGDSEAQNLGRGAVLTLDTFTLGGRQRATVENTHAIAEAFKHAFADRSRWLGDPAFVPIPTAMLLSAAYLDARAATFDPRSVMAIAKYGTVPPQESPAPPADHGTSHLNAVDSLGNAVACTETLNLEFGSLLAVPEFGFVLNNEMDDFTTRRGEANAFNLIQSERNMPAWSAEKGGKRPLSSMTPTIVLDEKGEVAVVAGASGGPRIITGTAQAILNATIRGMSAAESVSRPRVHHQWAPDTLLVERFGDRDHLQDALWEDAFKKRLEAIGHHVEIIDLASESADPIGNAQLIKRAGNAWDAACDPRKGGRPAGN